MEQVVGTISRDSILGFYELDESGIIRYSSQAASGEPGISPVVGQDFFESAAFRNGDELRRLFKRFLESRDAADSFHFDCLFDTWSLHTKVTLTRAYQTESFPPESIVMLSIMESGR
jgi:hypothetical protein